MEACDTFASGDDGARDIFTKDGRVPNVRENAFAEKLLEPVNRIDPYSGVADDQLIGSGVGVWCGTDLKSRFGSVQPGCLVLWVLSHECGCSDICVELSTTA